MNSLTRHPAVYMLASQLNGTLYVGVTSDLVRRVWEHKSDAIDGFTKRYGIHTLVWFELHATMPLAIEREKQVKKWRRAWKIEMIEQSNPGWRDLFTRTFRLKLFLNSRESGNPWGARSTLCRLTHRFPRGNDENDMGPLK